MYIDLETFERIKAQWADDPDELARLQRGSLARARGLDVGRSLVVLGCSE